MAVSHESASKRRPLYTLRPTTAPVASADSLSHNAAEDPASVQADPFLRPEAEDDDGYDPFSDRPPIPEPPFTPDPWD